MTWLVTVAASAVALVVVTMLYLRIRAEDLRGLGDELGMMEEKEVGPDR
jgi:hypothetical protein